MLERDVIKYPEVNEAILYYMINAQVTIFKVESRNHIEIRFHIHDFYLYYTSYRFVKKKIVVHLKQRRNIPTKATKYLRQTNINNMTQVDYVVGVWYAVVSLVTGE